MSWSENTNLRAGRERLVGNMLPQRAIRRRPSRGGALTVELIAKLRAIFPHARIFPMYGLTEAFRSTFLDPALVATHPTSIGTARGSTIPPLRWGSSRP